MDNCLLTFSSLKVQANIILLTRFQKQEEMKAIN